MKYGTIDLKSILNTDELFSYVIYIQNNFELENLKEYIYVLDEKEKKKFSRYKVMHKKVEFLLGRLVSKGIIGLLLNQDPENILFNQDQYGKLTIKDTSNNLGIHFNLSHTNGMLVCGISNVGEIGVDVERIDREYMEVMQLVFTKKEINYVECQDNIKSKKEAFYKIWTRKEAYMKLNGKGFSLQPLSFTVPFNTDICLSNETIYLSKILLDKYMVSTAVFKDGIEKRNHIKFINVGFRQLNNLITKSRRI